jgi:hypothetical protein
VEFGGKALLRRPVDKTPDGGAAITVLRFGTDRIARLEGEVFLYIVDGREVVVLDFAELQEAIKIQSASLLNSVQYQPAPTPV